MREWIAENNYHQRINIEFLNDKSKLLTVLAHATTNVDFQRLLSTAVNASLSRLASSSIHEDE